MSVYHKKLCTNTHFYCPYYRILLEISQSKLVAPSIEVICLGILVDTVEKKPLSISSDKIQQIKTMCNSWVNKNIVPRTSSNHCYIGSLLYITKCIKPARFFFKSYVADIEITKPQ